MLPTLCRSSEAANRIKCSRNLRQIGQAIAIYRNDHDGALPRTLSDDSPNPVPVFFTKPEAPDPVGPGGPGPNDVTAALYLLLRTGDIIPEAFVCPSSVNEKSSQDLQKTSNFSGSGVLSYSYHNPYAPAGLPQDGPKDFALAADISPGGPALRTTAANAPRQAIRQVNSPNHAGEGQNVLYADGHTDWYASPFAGRQRAGAAGPQRDNIYIAGGPGTGSPAAVAAAPADADDSILLPVSPTGP